MKKWNKRRGDFVKQRITNNMAVVRFLFEEMYEQQIHERDFAERVGFHRDTIRKWRVYHQPRVNDLNDCLSYLGYELKVVKKHRKGSKEDV
jgi:hypothetical protein